MPDYLRIAAAIAASVLAAPAQAQGVNIMLMDRFGGHSLEWDQPEGATVKVQDGALRYDTHRNNLFTTSQHIADGVGFVVAVKTHHVSGVTDWMYGLNFAGHDSENQYFFAISADGLFQVGQFDQGRWGTLKEWTAHPAINKGMTAENRLMVDVLGTWKFYVNDVLVHSMPGKNHSGRNSGVVVENVQAVDFDDFFVAEYGGGISDTEFGRKFAAVFADLRSGFKLSKGTLVDKGEFHRAWSVKDPLPGFVSQSIGWDPVLEHSYRANVGWFATQGDAISALMTLRDRIQRAPLGCPLLDMNDFAERTGASFGPVIKTYSWTSFDALTKGSGPCRGVQVHINILEPTEKEKRWGTSLSVFIDKEDK